MLIFYTQHLLVLMLEACKLTGSTYMYSKLEQPTNINRPLDRLILTRNPRRNHVNVTLVILAMAYHSLSCSLGGACKSEAG